MLSVPGAYSAATCAIMRWRIAASGSRPIAAPMLSIMCLAWLVAGVATVTAGLETTN